MKRVNFAVSTLSHRHEITVGPKVTSPPQSAHYLAPMSQGTHSYFDWQVSTLMLAYDVAQPLARDDEKAMAEREQHVQRELYTLVRAILPKEYLENPQSDFPPEIVVLLTRGTIARAAQILGMVEEDEEAK